MTTTTPRRHKFILEIESILESRDQLGTPIFDHAHKKFMWICIKVQKKKAISLICSGDMIDYKILQPDWLRKFWPICQEQKFSQIWDFCKNTANNINFQYRKYPVKINDQTFQ